MAKKEKSIQKKTLSSPDDVRNFDKGKLELATIGGITFGRASFEPGWRWSESVKPIVKTEYCEAPHVQYHISGRLRVKMIDGTELEYGPGDVGVVPSGHDAWVVGDEPVVVIDISGMKEYAKPTARKAVKRTGNAKPATKKVVKKKGKAKAGRKRR
jgi:hypothetical protein